MYKILCKPNGQFIRQDVYYVLYGLEFRRTDVENAFNNVTTPSPGGKLFNLKRSAQAFCRQCNKLCAKNLGMQGVFEVVEEV